MTGVTKAIVCAILCGMVHKKEPLLLIRKSSPCGGSGLPLSLSEWSFTICLILSYVVCVDVLCFVLPGIFVNWLHLV